MILYAAADLFWGSKIKAHAEALGLAARPVRTLEMLEARLADCPDAKAVMIDLDKGEEALSLIRRVRAWEAGGGRHLHVLAWGPHVAKDMLQAARDAGANNVMTRGALEHNMDELLIQLEGRG